MITLLLVVYFIFAVLAVALYHNIQEFETSLAREFKKNFNKKFAPIWNVFKFSIVLLLGVLSGSQAAFALGLAGFILLKYLEQVLIRDYT